MIGDARRLDSISLAEFQRIGQGQPAGRMTAHKAVLKIGALRGADRPIPVIVQHKELDGQVESPYGLQFLAVHLKSAIAVNRDGTLLSGGDAGAQRGRDSKAHGPEAFRVENPHSGLDRERLHRNFAARSGTAGHQQIITVHLFGKHLNEHVVIDGSLLFPILREHDRVSRLPTRHPRTPGRPVSWNNRSLLRQKFAQECLGIRRHGYIDPGVQFSDLRRIDIHHYFARAASEVLVGESDLTIVQPRSHAEQIVGVLQREIGPPLAYRPSSSGVKRMIVGNQVERLPGGDHRGL